MLPKDSINFVIDRFVAACQADERVVAAFLGGSYARHAADDYSDLDFGVILTDDAFDQFSAEREVFVRLLGEPLFLEDFDLPDILFIIFASGVEAEIVFGRQSRFNHIYSGSYRVLVDKTGVLASDVFPRDEAAPAEQSERLRRLIAWFWHDLSHFITAMARGQLWWAYGQLEALRRCCVTLAHLRHDSSAALDVEEPYFKIERALPVEMLAPLQATFCPLEREAMLEASMAIVKFYRESATGLAAVHGINYPVELERIIVGRLEKLRQPETS